MKTLNFKLLSFLLFFAGFLNAQNYPVQTTIQLTPPYTSYLPDYTDGMNSKLQVALNIVDINEAILQVKLKVSLEGPSGKIVTNPNFIQTPITLNFGSPLILSGDDLAPYLAVNNLLFPSAQFKQEYQQKKVLPEGLWKLCVEVLDATNPSAEPLSTNNCALMFVARLQTPMLNLPICESTIPRSQSIFFTWTDLSLGSYIAGNEPEYEFALYSVPISAYSNPTQVLNTNPIYTETTTLTSLNLDTSQVFIPAGQKYLWQVRAKLPDGSGAYLNNGYSAPCTFVFGDLAQEVIDDLTINLSAVAGGPTHGVASWAITSASGSNLSFDEYIIAYRKTGNSSYYWYEEIVSGFNKDILQLEASTEYEVKIKGLITGLESNYSTPVTFTTSSVPNYACGDGNLTPLTPNYTPLPPSDAFVGIKVRQGQFDMDVTSIESLGNGHYKGTGRVKVDFLLISLNVSFEDLLIDNLYTVRQGEINVITQDLGDWINDGYLAEADIENVNGTITDGSFTNDTTVVVTTTEGTYTFTFDNDLPIVVHDDDNNEWQFWPDGTIVKTTYGITPSEDKLDISKDLFVYFKDEAGQQSPTDVKEYAQFTSNYETILASDGFAYFTANKSAPHGTSDQINAVLHSSDFLNYDFSQVSFKLNGALDTIGYSRIDSNFRLTLPPLTANSSLYVHNGQQRIGKLNILVMPQKTITVHVVPLVNMTYSETDIENELNALFKGANLVFDIDLQATFSDATFNSSTTFSDPNTDLLSKYTSDMRALRDAYLENNTIPAKDYLVFVIPSFANSAIDGYMVRGKALGFVSSATITSLPLFGSTLAHELGHGIGGLRHAWGEEIAFRGKTNNLMDYNNGSKLIAQQWKDLQNPPVVISLFDTEEDGETFTVETAGIDKLLKFKNGNVFTFVDPAGRPISIPITVSKLQFASPDSRWFKEQDGSITHTNIAPIGSLISFTLNGVTYSGHMGANSMTFFGFEDPNDVDYVDSPPVSYDYILAGVPKIKGGNIRFSVCPLNVSAVLASPNAIVGGDVPISDKFKLLIDFFDANSENQSEEILAEYSGQITKAELDLLNFYRTEAFGVDAVYAIEILHLLRSNPILGGCVSSIFGQTTYDIADEIRQEAQIEDQANLSQFPVAVSDATSLSLATISPAFSMKELALSPNLFPNSSIANDERFYQKFYLSLTDWVADLNDVHEYYYYNVAGVDDIDVGSYSDKIYQTLTTEQRSCYLSKLSVQQRIQILNEYSEWTLGSQKERLILEVIANTPKSQYGLILDEFKKDGFALLKGANGDLWGADNQTLFHQVSWMVIDHKDAKINYTIPTIIYETGSSPATRPTIVLQKDYSGGYKTETSASWNRTGDIKFVIKHYEHYNQQIYGGYFYVDPYEIIVVNIMDDYQFAGIDGKPARGGGTFTMPAIYAYWMIQEQQKIESLTAVRVLLDVVAIGASIVTVNPGPFLIAEAVVGAVDIVFALTEESINIDGTPEQKQLHAAWNNIAALAGGAGGVFLAKKAITAGFKYTFDRAIYRNFINSIRSTPEELIKLKSAIVNGFKLSPSRLFSSGYNIMYDEIRLAIQEAELALLKGVQQDVNLVLSGGNDVVKVGYNVGGSMKYSQLGYLDVASDGKTIFSQLSITDDVAQCERVVHNLDNVNYIDNAGNLVNQKDLSVVRMKNGSTLVMSRASALRRQKINTLMDLVGDNASKIQLEADLLSSNSLLNALDNNKELVDSWKKLYNFGADDAIRRNPGALDALSKPKGSRPDPSTYLDADYVANHLAKFDDGAVRFTKQSSIDEYGTLGPQEAFTMPKSEFDNLFAETGGDLAQIETKLGLNARDLTGDDAVIAWIKKTDLGEVKIPSGNEGGVIDEFWIPGGKTSGGVSEAIIDLSNPNLPYTPL